MTPVLQRVGPLGVLHVLFIGSLSGMSLDVTSDFSHMSDVIGRVISFFLAEEFDDLLARLMADRWTLSLLRHAGLHDVINTLKIECDVIWRHHDRTTCQNDVYKSLTSLLSDVLSHFSISSADMLTRCLKSFTTVCSSAVNSSSSSASFFSSFLSSFFSSFWASSSALSASSSSASSCFFFLGLEDFLAGLADFFDLVFLAARPPCIEDEKNVWRSMWAWRHTQRDRHRV